MTTALAVSNFADLDDVQRAAKMMLASGYFEAQRDPAVGVAQLAVKILAGREMGYGPFAAVQGIHVIQGKPALSANLMAAAVKANPRYDYRVRKMEASECSLEFFQLYDGKRESLGVSTFTLADATKAGVKNLDKFPRNMLFARAMSNGVRWFCPDVFSGNTVYVPDELGAMVDGETGEIIDAEPQRQPVQAATTQRPSTPQPTETVVLAKHQNGAPMLTQERPSTPQSPPVTEVTESVDNPFDNGDGDGDGHGAYHDGDTGTPTSEELSIIGAWGSPPMAQEWVIKAGLATNEFSARNAWMNAVKECGGFSAKNAAQVKLAYLRERRSKHGTPSAAELATVPEMAH